MKIVITETTRRCEVLEGRIPRTPVNRPLNAGEASPGGEISRTEVIA
jgi:hypothetical protein